MNRAALRALGRVLRGRPYRGKRRRTKADIARQDEAWVGELLGRTPPAEARLAEPWRPRIARWVRVVCPFDDDTIFLTPVPAATVLDLMAGTFVWDPS